MKHAFENEYEHDEQFVRAVFQNRYEFVKTYLPAIRVLWQEMAFHDDIKAQFQTIFINHVYEKFKQIVEHFQQKGELAPLPPETIIRLTITTIAGFLLTRFLVMPDYPWMMNER
ncbi:hypothetical protein LR68_04336 [Anoxybacillus sp. BCO1]|nr:hypothetical protein LR68_04336 [Anoxybacillus sp. BCO1]